MQADEVLPSWRDTPSRAAVLEFVARVTDPNRPDFVPVPDRVAVFDNDGTLWTEKPLPIQADFLLRRVGEMAQVDPGLTSRQPWKAVVEGDHAWLANAVVKHYQGDDRDLQEMAAGLLAAYEGRSVEAFAEAASAFTRAGIHPTLQRPYLACGFRPMIELLRMLEANDFTCYIVSGGGRDFMRTVADQCYGIPPERVIGSSVTLEYREVEGVAELVHSAHLELLDDGPAKPVALWSHIGRRPIIAGGNANGDIPMLAFAGGPRRPALRLVVRHDDPDREFAYEAEAREVLARAATDGWTVISMKEDWTTVFAPPSA